MIFNPIHFILTWWTIDSYYEWSKDTAIPLKHSCIPWYIKSLKLYNSSKFTEVCMKDSRNIVKSDLNNILKAVEWSDCKHIIITHWTYTMPDSARFLEANLKRKDQVVILTASMIPITWFSPSDWPFALGYAIAKIQDLSNWVYACINWNVFKPSEVVKIISEWRFTSIFSS